MKIAEKWPGLGGPHDVVHLPVRYIRRLRAYLFWEMDKRNEAIERAKRGEDNPDLEELEKADWDAESVETNTPR